MLWQLSWGGAGTFNQDLYTWFEVGRFSAHVGFMVDRLTAMMMVVVTFVSLMVHIYTIGYMADDDGFQRFFSYIALFTFSMLMLVMSNNFLQLFFGWEAVGLVSYLLIGFWFKRPSAIFANLKAFLVNRVGDFGFLLGIAGVLFWFGSLDYAQVFAGALDPAIAAKTVEIFAGHPWHVMTVICICLFVGAMGKSAQVPLHVWLPDSMEGPTPISALIHAATMVTAGIFMVARMSPLFELSETALSFVLIIGATTALFTGLIGIVQNDIKRVVAYSTLSQLGYMTVALGVSAYAGGVYHLMTHAFFKALLFLGAGSVIIAMHHEQDMRYMGGLRKYMPITWITMWIGSLALAGAPGFAGFFSKDAIIEAVGESHRCGSGYAYFCVLAGVFVTALYSFRLLYMTFHGEERFVVDAHHGHDDDHGHHAPGHLAHAPHESPWVVTVPLMLLAIPSVADRLEHDRADAVRRLVRRRDPRERGERRAEGTGWRIPRPVRDGPARLHASAVLDRARRFRGRDVHLAAQSRHRRQGEESAASGLQHPRAQVLVRRGVSGRVRARWRPARARALEGRRRRIVIDGLMVDGSAAVVERIAATVRWLQSGYLYHYAFAMILGLIALLGGLWWVVGHVAG